MKLELENSTGAVNGFVVDHSAAFRPRNMFGQYALNNIAKVNNDIGNNFYLKKEYKCLYLTIRLCPFLLIIFLTVTDGMISSTLS